VPAYPSAALRGYPVILTKPVADMTVVGWNAAYRTLRADRLTRAPAGLDTAETDEVAETHRRPERAASAGSSPVPGRLAIAC
jgi:hypothetical protein